MLSVEKVGAAMAWQPTKRGRVETAKKLEIEGLNPRLASIRVLPNKGEDAHPNFPRNLHSAVELLVRVGHIDSAQQHGLTRFRATTWAPQLKFSKAKMEVFFVWSHLRHKLVCLGIENGPT